MQKKGICIHVGQCGVQTGSAVWELFCLEHGIGPDGRVLEGGGVPTNAFAESSSSFFYPTKDGKMIPRVVMVDLEPTALDKVRVGKYKNLYRPDHLISGKEDAANNYARGHYSVGRRSLETVCDAIKKVAEQCENFQGFIVFYSVGGGTGSGLGTLLTERLVKEYPKKSKLEFVVYPAPQTSSSVVEPYNSVLSTHNTLLSNFSDCTFMLDNQALYDISHKKLCIDRPSYTTLNRIIAQVVSSVTSSLRFEGPANVDLSEYQVNLVPFPRLYFSTTSYSPIISHTKVFHERIGISDITSECFEKSSQLVKCDLKKGKFIACCLLYRGDVVPNDINTVINKIKSGKNINFVEWCPTGVKVGINRREPCQFPSGELAKVSRAVCMLANTTAIVEPWDKLTRKFDLMYSKKAFVHWFIMEGMEKEQFEESRGDIEMLKLDYLEVQKEIKPPSQRRENEI